MAKQTFMPCFDQAHPGLVVGYLMLEPNYGKHIIITAEDIRNTPDPFIQPIPDLITQTTGRFLTPERYSIPAHYFSEEPMTKQLDSNQPVNLKAEFVKELPPVDFYVLYRRSEDGSTPSDPLIVTEKQLKFHKPAAISRERLASLGYSIPPDMDESGVRHITV